MLHRQYSRLVAVDEELAWYNDQLKHDIRQDAVCQRLLKIPGFGPIVSKAVKSWVDDGKQFVRVRGASAALGLVPKQFSTGGRNVLLGITKRGDPYVRGLVIQEPGLLSGVRQEKTTLFISGSIVSWLLGVLTRPPSPWPASYFESLG